MLNRTQAPKIFDAVDFNLQLQPCIKFSLNNGTSVYAIDAGAEDVIMLEFVFYAGSWYEEKNIVAATTNFLLKNGTKTKNAFAISEHFDFYGAYLTTNCYSETATLTVHTLAKHLPELLPVVAEILTQSIFSEDEINIYKQNQKQKLKVNLKKCDFVANRLIDEYVYGFNHPYGKYTVEKDYDIIDRTELINFYNEFYTHGKCLLFVAGKLPANIQSQLNNAFGNLPFNQNKNIDKQIVQTSALQKKYHIVNDENDVQAAIRIAAPFPNRHHPDFQKFQLLNTVFGGYFGSRLMSNIREDKGYTYGIQSYVQNHIHDTALIISTEAGRDVAAATINEVYREMKLLQAELIDEEELNLVRNYMIGSILGDLDGPFPMIARWKNYILNGLDEKYFYNGINLIKTVTAEELQQLAQKYLHPENFYELTVI